MGQKNIIGKLSVSSTEQNLTSGSKFAQLEENKLHILDLSSYKWADCGIDGISIGQYDDGSTLQPMKLILSTVAETVTYDMKGISYGNFSSPSKLLFPSFTGQAEITPAFYDSNGYSYHIGGQGFQIGQYKIGIYSSLTSSKLALTEDDFDGVEYKIYGIEHYRLNRETYETSTYTYNFPEKSGTFALIEDLGNSGGLGDFWSIDSQGQLTYTGEGSQFNCVLRIPGYTNYVDLVQNTGLRISSDDPSNRSQIQYGNGSIEYTHPADEDDETLSIALTFPRSNGVIATQEWVGANAPIIDSNGWINIDCSLYSNAGGLKFYYSDDEIEYGLYNIGVQWYDSDVGDYQRTYLNFPTDKTGAQTLATREWVMEYLANKEW